MRKIGKILTASVHILTFHSLQTEKMRPFSNNQAKTGEKLAKTVNKSMNYRFLLEVSKIRNPRVTLQECTNNSLKMAMQFR